MPEIKFETVEALGLKWTLTPATVEADQGRTELQEDADRYVNLFIQPAARYGAGMLLRPYFADILAATVSVERLDVEQTTEQQKADYGFLISLFKPENWANFVRTEGTAKDKAGELKVLLDAATAINPHWYPARLVVTEETQEAEATIDTAVAYVTPDSTTPALPSEAATEAAGDTLLEHAEKAAKEAGLEGASSFSGTAKGKARRR